MRASDDFLVLNSLGRMKARATMKTAGVAEAILSLDGFSLSVYPVKIFKICLKSQLIHINIFC